MKIVLFGYGKMGKAIEGLVNSEGKHEVVLIVDPQDGKGLDINDLKNADVAIDFSIPTAAYSNIKTCINASIPIVSGTTGWTEKLNELREFADEKEVGFIYASNFSIGVNVFFHLNKKLAEMLSSHAGYQPQMEEIHHKEKLDSPSGTAITLAEDILHSSANKEHWVNEHSIDPKALSILSRREEDIAGVHDVKWKSAIDEIEIKHTAKSREGFVRGAIYAAEWIIARSGFHTMDQVLDL